MILNISFNREFLFFFDLTENLFMINVEPSLRGTDISIMSIKPFDDINFSSVENNLRFTGEIFTDFKVKKIP